LSRRGIGPHSGPYEGKIIQAIRYHKGTFTWFPEGAVMERGATPESNVTVQFATNKSFRIDDVE
jgi:hypothetical protein